MKIIIIRLTDSGKQTIGIGHIVDGEKLLYTFRTLELPWKDNANNISCIPVGEYDAFKRVSPGRGTEVVELKDVPNRRHIQIHTGNYNTDILGCILVGTAFFDINNDGRMDITSSGTTLNNMLSIVKEFWLLIIDYDEQINS